VTAPGFYVGILTRVTVTATHDGGTALASSTVTLRGTGGIKGASSTTDPDGKVEFVVHPTRPGATFTVSDTPDGCRLKTIRARPGASDCSGESVTPNALVVGQPVTMTVSLRLRGQPVTQVKVVVKGAGIDASGVTDNSGRVRLRVMAKKPGIFRIAVPGALACAPGLRARY
jgi:hypothetical protein